VQVAGNELHVKDITEFIEAVSRLKSAWFPNEPNWGPWFRGHAQADWKLTPKLYRRSPTQRSIRVIEDDIRQEFSMRAPGLTRLTEDKPQNPWEWYFIMQHSGAPTRLLDWTEGALIALYFAVRDSVGSNDASVWVLEPWRLNERVVGEPEVIAPGTTAGVSEVDAGRYRPWLPDLYVRNAELPNLPVAVYPSHSARRVSTQRSCFTVHGSDVEGLEKLGREEPPFLLNVVVSGSAVRDIAEQLVLCGVDELTIFPDVDGLGRFLSTMLKAELDENGI
jgi:hypothetical protein